jgi:hypothetical protein
VYISIISSLVKKYIYTTAVQLYNIIIIMAMMEPNVKESEGSSIIAAAAGSLFRKKTSIRRDIQRTSNNNIFWFASQTREECQLAGNEYST